MSQVCAICEREDCKGCLQICVERMTGFKCPRCWQYWGIPDNYQGCCDECIGDLIEGMDNWVEAGNFSREVANQALAEIRACKLAQAKKWLVPDAN